MEGERVKGRKQYPWLLIRRQLVWNVDIEESGVGEPVRGGMGRERDERRKSIKESRKSEILSGEDVK